MAHWCDEVCCATDSHFCDLYLTNPPSTFTTSLTFSHTRTSLWAITMGIASKMAAYAAPSHPPPQTTSGSTNPFSDSISTPSTSAAPAAQADPFESAIPDEAPPAYTAAAPPGDAHLAAGPARMDFSGPPPMSQPQHPPPNRLENQITGVGIGYGPRRDHGQSSPHHSPNAASAPSMPPRHPSHHQSTPSSGSSSSLNRPSPQGGSQDTTPTQVATPGRPLLRNGQLLVYPKGFMCHKCTSEVVSLCDGGCNADHKGGNTGYKNADPSNPHDTVSFNLLMDVSSQNMNS